MTSYFASDSAIERVPTYAQLFFSLLERVRVGHLTLVMPSGERRIFGNSMSLPGAVLTIHDWRACSRILKSGDIGFADAYQAGWLDTPDLTDLLRFALCNEAVLPEAVWGKWISRLWYALLHRLRVNSRAGSKRNIHAHYDIGNAFYKQWLDPGMSYSSALFAGEAAKSLEQAQTDKYEHIVQSLALRPGMQVLEIGCGWGGFALHAARQGIRVHAVTISEAQYELARQRILDEGLTEVVRVELCDYRDLHGQYDAVVSIEMFEAVGEKFWPEFGRILHERLKPGAQALLQSITIDEARFEHYRRSSDFIRQAIFPGGMLPSPERLLGVGRKAGLEGDITLRFGLDYAETLRRWRQAFEKNLAEVRRLGFDDAFVRVWRLYLAYCEAGFEEQRTDVVQFVFTRPS
ncbi:SAM-dependent methyltransferase [Paracandidimonas soli]|uniref:Cyclopropane-fatty-acyl-phospholipid synthase n=1 Tax=Paracandidimonas soli TaxID=1917182 RepID=A0A4R3V5U9_9BURK|nr:cyclopropane-fatty-acyl-phospholipid synthase family protein [Paracandidimonas soli]TCU98941.1 cyclopropane-fatty-acyl-phospholipid synthase [Paracandidimonas soli]